MALELITDRTQADVFRWLYLRNKGYSDMTAAERAEWAAGMKGAYKHSDLNRVGTALNLLRDLISQAGYIAPSTPAKTDWKEGDIPTAKDLSEYLRQVEIVRAAIAQFETTPQTPSGPSLDYEDANNIEKILLDIEKIIENMNAAVYYCGELYSGEV